MVYHREVVILEAVTVIEYMYRGRRQSLLPARETNLTACGLKILRQIILPARKLNPGPCSARLTV